MLEVKIGDLPKKITAFEAVENCYSEQLRFACARLREGVSVLIRCEKQIIPYLQGIMKKKLAAEGKTTAIIDGRGNPNQEATATRISTMVTQLRGLVNNTEPNKVFLLPYLDILTSTAMSGLTQEGKEIMTVIHENPLLAMAAFEDPDFPLPDLIARAFPARTEMLGIPRQKLAALITSDEARKFGMESLNLMSIFKYVSGLNPVGFRGIMQIFAHKADYNPSLPNQTANYLQELRDYTATGGACLSSINLEKDIAGYGKVKRKIEENILRLLRATAQLTDEKEIRNIESIIPRGLIFHGPPGTGKTLFAKGIAEALNAAIFIVSGPELKSKWFGEGEANIRRLFARARATAPSVIVFDELDSIASARTGGDDGAAQASHSMVNQLLTEMDGFRKEDLVLIIGTTNFVSCLDPAFLRPGRFEYQIEIPYPEWEDRRAILALYNKVFGTGVSDADIDMLAGWTGRLTDNGTSYTGDHLNALMRDLKRRLLNINENAADSELLKEWLREQAGVTRLDEHEENVVAIHEAGHAVMYLKAGRFDEIDKVTLESGSSAALGMVQSQVRKPNHFFTESRLRGQIGISLGGYVAEKIFFGEVSTGASGDLRHATLIASDMVSAFGMGDAAVPRNYTDQNYRPDPFFLAQLSPRVDHLLTQVLADTAAYIKGNRPLLEKISRKLIELRTLNPADLASILKETQGA